MTENKIKKYRECRHCKKELFGTAETLRSHAVICSFEIRTGLTVVQERPDFSLRVVHES